MCLSDVRDLTGLGTAHPYAFADDETVRILGQDHTVVCNVNMQTISIDNYAVGSIKLQYKPGTSRLAIVSLRKSNRTAIYSLLNMHSFIIPLFWLRLRCTRANTVLCSMQVQWPMGGHLHCKLHIVVLHRSYKLSLHSYHRSLSSNKLHLTLKDGLLENCKLCELNLLTEPSGTSYRASLERQKGQKVNKLF